MLKTLGIITPNETFFLFTSLFQTHYMVSQFSIHTHTWAVNITHTMRQWLKKKKKNEQMQFSIWKGNRTNILKSEETLKEAPLKLQESKQEMRTTFDPFTTWS
jgi:hypothetical protein